jgi:YVTN family beta-propeller protein
MSFRRVGRPAAMVLATLLCLGCGQVYRPVVIPCSEGGIPGCPPQTPPIPASFHAVFAMTTNAPNYPGGAMQIDVSGDAIIGETPSSDTKFGGNPTHMAILPNDSKVFVASAGSVTSGQIDVVSSFSPASQSTTGTGLGPLAAVGLPSQTSNISTISEAGGLVTATLSAPLNNLVAGYAIVIAGVVIPGCAPPGCNPLAYNGTFALSSISGATIQYVNPVTGLAPSSGGTASVPPQPVFLNSTQSGFMYVANYNSNSVSAINTGSNSVSNSAMVGTHPVSLAETPNGNKLYVANQGSNTISSLNTVDLSSNVVTGFTGKTPVWVVARGDSQKVYVLTQGDGQLVTIDTATDSVTSSIAVGAGANFIFFDPHLNRLYVTNPQTSTLYVFSDTGGANDTPIQLTSISFSSGSAPCPAGCSPASVTALADGSRFYVASYQTESSCPDAVLGTSSACVIPGLTVFDANSFALMYPAAPTLTLLTYPPFAANLVTNQYQYAVPPIASCASPVLPALYAPGATRFRVFTTASADSSRVYVSMCDAGAIAVINTTGSNTNNGGGSGVPADTVITDLPAPYGICTQTSCGSAASITAFSIASNVVTFQAANAFTAGQTVSISGLSTGTYLNGVTMTVLATGLSSSQFECYFSSPDTPSTSDSGTAFPSVPSQTPVFMLTGQ